MLIIRFARVGRKGQPFFHLVVAEKARSVKKKYLEKLGYYNPLAEGGKGELVFEKDRVLYYVNHGAQMSQTVARLLTKEGLKEAGKFVVERVNKPKKTPPPETEAPAAKETPEEVPTEEKAKEAEPAPAEEKKEEEKGAETAPAEEVKEEAPAAEEKKEEAPAEEKTEESATEEPKEKDKEEDKKEEE